MRFDKFLEESCILVLMQDMSCHSGVWTKNAKSLAQWTRNWLAVDPQRIPSVIVK